jgi:hypothetical protein
MFSYKSGKDLTKISPRSPHAKVGGFKIVGRTIDKCRALLWGTIGEYEFDCGLDNQFFTFMGVKGTDFKKFVEEGHSDEEIVAWVKANGNKKTEEEIDEWNAKVSAEDYSSDPENGPWLVEMVEKAGMPKGTKLFDWLDEDDRTSH